MIVGMGSGGLFSAVTGSGFTRLENAIAVNNPLAANAVVSPERYAAIQADNAARAAAAAAVAPKTMIALLLGGAALVGAIFLWRRA